MTDGMITCFDNVFWVTIPKESNPEKLQMAIAKAVRLNLPEDWNMMDKAAELLKALQRRKRLLLLIDDVWTPFSLENIGIPALTRANGDAGIWIDGEWKHEDSFLLPHAVIVIDGEVLGGLHLTTGRMALADKNKKTRPTNFFFVG
ncbi:hypothetical protein ACLB2K_016913 [Fragaria x ananassa]